MATSTFPSSYAKVRFRDSEIPPTEELRFRDSEIPPTEELSAPRLAIYAVDGNSDLCYTESDSKRATTRVAPTV